MKKLLLCVLALGCAAVLMACEWSAVPLPLEGDEPQVISPAPDPSEITGQLAEYTRDHVDMALTIPDGWAFETLEEDGQAGLRFWKTDDDAVYFRLTCWLDGYGICGTDVKLLHRTFKGFPESMYPIMVGQEGVAVHRGRAEYRLGQYRVSGRTRQLCVYAR